MRVVYCSEGWGLYGGGNFGIRVYRMKRNLLGREGGEGS